MSCVESQCQPSRGRPAYRRLLALFAVLASLAPGLADAQGRADQPPQAAAPAGGPWDESVLWWTLSDRLTPKQLKAELSDPAGHLRRYQAAYERGLAPALSEEELAQLSFFHQGSVSPELLPLWRAFDSFALSCSRTNGEARFRDLGSSTYGLSSKGIDRIVRAAEDLRACTQRSVREGPEKRARYKGMVSAASARTRRQFGKDQLSAEEIQAIAQATSSAPEEVQELEKQSRLGPRAPCAGPRLIALRGQLENRDWNGLRTYLLREIAPDITRIAYEDSEVD